MFPKPQVPQPSPGEGSWAPAELRTKPESRASAPCGPVQVSIRLAEAIRPLWGVRTLRAWY